MLAAHKGINIDAVEFITVLEGAEVTGNMPDHRAAVITPGTAQQGILAGYHNGAGYVAGDAQADHHGLFVRYDTQSDFNTASAWASYDPGNAGVGG